MGATKGGGDGRMPREPGTVSSLTIPRTSPALECELRRLVELWADPDGRQAEERGTVIALLEFLHDAIVAIVGEVSDARRQAVVREAVTRHFQQAADKLFYGKRLASFRKGQSGSFNRFPATTSPPAK